MIATPTYARDVAIQLAEVCGESFVMMPSGEERDRFWAMAAWIVDEFVAGDDFHEGCVAEDAAEDWEEEGFEAGYERAQTDALKAIAELGAGSRGERREAFREAYKAARGTESRQAMDAMVSAHRSQRRASS